MSRFGRYGNVPKSIPTLIPLSNAREAMMERCSTYSKGRSLATTSPLMI